MKKFIYPILVLILIVATGSRFYNLTFQSLWFDELYVVNVSNPQHTFSDIMEFMKVEFHPPFHFFLCNVVFKIFGYSDFVARFLSAILGVCGILAMYFLGKELKDNRLGYIMALLTAFNAYHLYHSQEVRMYVTIFFWAAVSLIYFLRILKNQRLIDTVLFTFVSVLMLYTHYYGAFVMLAYGAYFLMTWAGKSNNKLVVSRLFWSFLAIFILYAPYLPFIFNTAGREHWMGLPPVYFFFVYLYDYVGKDPVSALFYFAGLIVFIIYFVREKSKSQGKTVLLLILISVYILSYLVSVFKPVMQLRSTFIGLPFVIAMVSLGWVSLKEKYQWISLSLVIVSSTIVTVFVNEYFYKPRKEDFREIAKLVIAKHPYTLSFSHYASFFTYYFKQYNNQNRVIDPIDVDTVEILDGVDTLLLLNAHNEDNIMTMPELYSSFITLLNQNFSIDTTYFSRIREGENAVVYIRRQQ